MNYFELSEKGKEPVIPALFCLLFPSTMAEEELYQISQNFQGSEMVNLLNRISGNTCLQLAN